jgi:DNA-binding NarL/FixJ family response regulator
VKKVCEMDESGRVIIEFHHRQAEFLKTGVEASSRSANGDMRWTARTILLVEREDQVLEILRTALESRDYVILQAKTGDAALALLSRLKADIDLAIIDLDLPNDDGLAISLLTTFGRRKPTTKFIVKTSRHDKPFLEHVYHFGIDAIVLKPISEEQFIKTVQATLSERRKGSAGPSAGTAEFPTALSHLPSANSAAAVDVRSKATQTPA